MRMYGRRFLKNSMADAAGARVESRDAVVIDIDYENKFCRVKIQGSEEYIIAHFPENTNRTPDWLKPANAVRICHRGGVRGKVEAVGPGQTIPTGIHMKPPQEIVPPDCILSGCELCLPVVERGAFANKGIVWVSMGSYRAQGTVKQTAPLRCRGALPLLMKNRAKIGSLAAQFVFSFPPEGEHQYQRIVIDGENGAVSAVAGNIAREPAMPELPQGKLDCGWVLLQGGKQFLEETDINAFWQKAEPCYFLLESDGYLPAERLFTTVKVTVKDQFGRDCKRSGQRWCVHAVLAGGLGELIADEESIGGGSRSLTVYSAQGEAAAVFLYARGTAVVTGRKDSPVIRVSVDSVPFPAMDLDIALFAQDGERL